MSVYIKWVTCTLNNFSFIKVIISIWYYTVIVEWKKNRSSIEYFVPSSGINKSALKWAVFRCAEFGHVDNRIRLVSAMYRQGIIPVQNNQSRCSNTMKIGLCCSGAYVDHLLIFILIIK